MTSIKIVQFSRLENFQELKFQAPCSFIYVQNSSTPLTLDVQLQANPPSPPPPTPLLLQMVTSQLKENIIQGWILHVIKSFLQVGFRFQYQTLTLSGFPSTSFHLAEASLSAISWLYALVCAVVNCVQLFTFLVLFRT